jgi:outer membrane protein
MHDRRFLRPSLGALTACVLPFLFSAGASADRFNISDRFYNALEAVQEGIDLLLPGDLDSQDVTARVGLGLGWTPDYEGSNNYRFRAIPLIDIRYKEVWRLNGGQFTYSAFRSGDFEAGPLLNLNGGRSENTNKALEGLGDISTTLDVGFFARYSTKAMLISGDVRQALGAGRGMQIRLTAGHGIYKSGNFAMGAGVRAKWLSGKAMQTSFGVTPEQSANSARGIEAYDANAGLSDISANLIGVYQLTPSVRMLGLVSVGTLLGSAADSPLTGGGFGSSTQFLGGTGIQFLF